jgi:thioredoxin reductase
MSTYRAAVVGAGPAGLAAALTLARSLQPTVVFDGDDPARNAVSPGIGGLLGRDLVEPAALKRAGMEEIERYGAVRFISRNVADIETRPSGGFTLTDDGGTSVDVDSVLLAWGMIDELPPFAGRRQQATPASADRGGAAARDFRRAHLRHRRRRTVLGQRPAGARAAVGA